MTIYQTVSLQEDLDVKKSQPVLSVLSRTALHMDAWNSKCPYNLIYLCVFGSSTLNFCSSN